MGLGVSGYHNTAIGGVENAGGGFGYLYWKRLTWVGELDWASFRPTGGGPAHPVAG